MEIFTFNGYDGEKIALKLKEIIGFPDSTSYEGGYDIICSLEIDVGCYKAKFDRYYSATGALYSFSLAAASYPFVDLPSGDTLRCKLFPADKFHKICYLFDSQ